MHQQLQRYTRRVIGVAVVAATFGATPAMAIKRDMEYTSILDRYKTEIDTMDVKAGEFEDISVFLGLKTAGRLQWLTQDNVFITPAPSEDNPNPAPVNQGDIDPGFQTAWGSMDFLASFGEHIDVYWEFFISSRPHQSEMQGSQGYMLFHSLPGGQLQGMFDYVDIKAGQYYMDYGDHHFRRSSNARVQSNPLVGNYVIDARSTDIGLEVATKNDKLNLMVGVGSGTEAESFTEGRGTAVHGKIWGNPIDSLRLSASGFWVDHSDNGQRDTRANLYRSLRDGGPYGGILDDGSAPGNVFVGAGQKVSAAQGDVTWLLGKGEVYAHVGFAEDADTNGNGEGSPTDSWIYYAAEGLYRFTENAYGAVRYSAAQADEIGSVTSNGRVDRIQAGGGYWITDYILAKLEYVYQAYADFVPADGTVSGVDASTDPEFQGLIAEVSLAF